MLHSSSKIFSANMARSPVGSCLCLLAWTLARGCAQKLLGPRWQGADKGVFGLLSGRRVFSVLVADYDKTCLRVLFFFVTCRSYAGALRAQTIRELTSVTSDSPHYLLILSFSFTFLQAPHLHTLPDTQKWYTGNQYIN